MTWRWRWRTSVQRRYGHDTRTNKHATTTGWAATAPSATNTTDENDAVGCQVAGKLHVIDEVVVLVVVDLCSFRMIVGLTWIDTMTQSTQLLQLHNWCNSCNWRAVFITLLFSALLFSSLLFSSLLFSGYYFRLKWFYCYCFHMSVAKMAWLSCLADKRSCSRK